MSRDNRQSYFDPYFGADLIKDDPYRDTGAYGYSQAPRESSKLSASMSREDAMLENFYAGGL